MKNFQKSVIALLSIIAIISTSILGILIFDNCVARKAIKETSNALNTISENFVEHIVYDETAKKGNLGCYNIEVTESKYYTNKDNSNFKNIAQIKLNFTNYSSKGVSFNEAVEAIAYCDDVEISKKSPVIDIFSDNIDVTPDNTSTKVRNGKSVEITLEYYLDNRDKDINIDFTSGDKAYTITVK